MPTTVDFEDEPRARAMYERMLEALGRVETVSYVSLIRSRTGRDGQRQVGASGEYRLWLDKAGRFQAQAVRFPDLRPTGVAVGHDGEVWVHWPAGEPFLPYPPTPQTPQDFREAYIHEPFDPARTSLTALPLGARVNPLLAGFYQGVLPRYLRGDGPAAVRWAGDEEVPGKPVIELRLDSMDAPALLRLWLHPQTHLPHAAELIVLREQPISVYEVAGGLETNGPLPDKAFQWTPPEHWTRWSPSWWGWWDAQTFIGKAAPEFALTDLSGSTVRLSDLRGRPVVLGFWSAESPEVLDALQRVHEAVGENGLAVVAVNFDDTPEEARAVLAGREVGLVIVDRSEKAREIFVGRYGVYQWPAFFVIDAEGVVVDTWRDEVDRLLPRLRERGLLAAE